MSTRVLRPIRGRRLRLTRLDSCGAPLESGCNTVVTDCFVSVDISIELAPGPTYVSRDIWGRTTVADAEPDQPLWASVRVRLADANPDVIELLAGQDPVLVDGEATGFYGGSARNFSAYALEVWAALAGDCSGWGYLSIPLVRNGRVDGSVSVQNGAATLEAVGTAFPATAAWGETPYAENPLGVPFAAGEIYAMAATSAAPPEPVDLALCPERLLSGAVLWLEASLTG